MKYKNTTGRGPGNEIICALRVVMPSPGHYQVFYQGAYLGSVACPPESVMLAVVNMLDRSFASGQRGVQNGK